MYFQMFDEAQFYTNQTNFDEPNYANLITNVGSNFVPNFVPNLAPSTIPNTVPSMIPSMTWNDSTMDLNSILDCDMLSFDEYGLLSNSSDPKFPMDFVTDDIYSSGIHSNDMSNFGLFDHHHHPPSHTTKFSDQFNMTKFSDQFDAHPFSDNFDVTKFSDSFNGTKFGDQINDSNPESNPEDEGTESNRSDLDDDRRGNPPGPPPKKSDPSDSSDPIRFGYPTCQPSNFHIPRTKRTILSRKPEQATPCRYCRQPFERGNSLRRHEFLHTGEKPFQCRPCRKQFSRSDILHRHQRSSRCRAATSKAEWQPIPY